MPVKRPPCPSDPIVSVLLDSLIPGGSAAAEELRNQVKEFSLNPSANTVLLRGPIGAGKSTLARMIGYFRRLAPLKYADAKEQVSYFRKERIHGKLPADGSTFANAQQTDQPNLIDVGQMEWYVEMSLTGLSDELATVQLFGCVKGAFTGAVEGPGIFEQARNGRAKNLKDASPGARVTGGIVFLDEIGDLSEALQAKLLPVVSGGSFYRVGGEGHSQNEITYRGLTIAATWHPDLSDRIRQDLWSRITTHVIDVPGLAERRDDLESLLDNQIQMIVAQRKLMVEDWCQGNTDVDAEYWRKHGSIPRELTVREREFLLDADWSSLGNLRGLTQTLQHVLFSDIPVREAVHSFPRRLGADPTLAHRPDELYRQLLQRRPNNRGLAAHIGEIERDGRLAFRDFVRGDPSVFAQLCQKLGIDPNAMRTQIDQLGRARGTTTSKETQ